MKFLLNVLMLFMLTAMSLLAIGLILASFLYGWITLVAAIIPLGIFVGILEYFLTDDNKKD